MEAFTVNSMGEEECTNFNVEMHCNGVVLKTELNQEAKQCLIWNIQYLARKSLSLLA